jgi:hypothetical protein
VIGWLVLEVTGSSTELGLVIFLYGVPNVTFLLIAGIVADRFDRRYVLMVTQAWRWLYNCRPGCLDADRCGSHLAYLRCRGHARHRAIPQYAGPDDHGVRPG